MIDRTVKEEKNVNKNLGLLLSGQLVSQIGDKFHMLAVSFLFSAGFESFIRLPALGRKNNRQN